MPKVSKGWEAELELAPRSGHASSSLPPRLLIQQKAVQRMWRVAATIVFGSFYSAASASSLCPAVFMVFGGGLGDVTLQALRDAGLYEGQAKVDLPYDLDRRSVWYAAVARYVEQEKIKDLSISAGRGQVIEDIVARYRVKLGELEETTQIYNTPRGDLRLSQYHRMGKPNEGVHSRITFAGQSYVGLSGNCHPMEGRKVVLPKLYRLTASDLHPDTKEMNFIAFLYEQGNKHAKEGRRVLIVTSNGLWLSGNTVSGNYGDQFLEK